MGVQKAQNEVKRCEQALAEWQDQKSKLIARRGELRAEREGLDLDDPKAVAKAMERMSAISTELQGIEAVLEALESKIVNANDILQAARDVLRQERLAKTEPERDAALAAVKDAVKALAEAMDRLDRANKAVRAVGGGRVVFKGYNELSRKVTSAVTRLNAPELDFSRPEPEREQPRRVWDDMSRSWRIGTFRVRG